VSSTTTARAGATAAAPGKGRVGKTDRAKAEARLGWYLAGPAFVILVGVTGYPILQALYESLFSFRLTAPADREFIGLRNYSVILTDSLWWSRS